MDPHRNLNIGKSSVNNMILLTLNILRLFIYSVVCCRQLKIQVLDGDNHKQWNILSKIEFSKIEFSRYFKTVRKRKNISICTVSVFRNKTSRFLEIAQTLKCVKFYS